MHAYIHTYMYTILNSECNVFLARDFRIVCDFIKETDKFYSCVQRPSTQNFSLIALIVNRGIHSNEY